METRITSSDSYDLTGFHDRSTAGFGALLKMQLLSLPAPVVTFQCFICPKQTLHEPLSLRHALALRTGLCRQVTHWTIILPTPAKWKEAEWFHHRVHCFFSIGWSSVERKWKSASLDGCIESNCVQEDCTECSWWFRDPMFGKVRDSYWWPNQYVTIMTYCHSCHKCQMRTTYRNMIPLQLQYVQMIWDIVDVKTSCLCVRIGSNRGKTYKRGSGRGLSDSGGALCPAPPHMSRICRMECLPYAAEGRGEI